MEIFLIILMFIILMSVGIMFVFSGLAIVWIILYFIFAIFAPIFAIFIWFKKESELKNEKRNLNEKIARGEQMENFVPQDIQSAQKGEYNIQK